MRQFVKILSPLVIVLVLVIVISPLVGWRRIAISKSVCLSVRSHIKTTGPSFIKFSASPVLMEAQYIVYFQCCG